jgi:hypothetical protein
MVTEIAFASLALALVRATSLTASAGETSNFPSCVLQFHGKESTRQSFSRIKRFVPLTPIMKSNVICQCQEFVTPLPPSLGIRREEVAQLLNFISPNSGQENGKSVR